MEAVDHHRVFKPSGSEIDDGYRNGHADTTDEVARPLPDIEALTAAVEKRRKGEKEKRPKGEKVARPCLELAAAGLKMAEKASEPF